jgi:autotransporter-associated beta strand protein
MMFPIAVFLKRYLLAGLVVYFTFVVASAQIWNSTGSGDWNTGTNWDTETVPNSSSAMATLGDASSVTIVTLSAGISLDTLLFNGTTTYSILTSGNSVTLDGFGINNASGVQQTLVNSNDGNVLFTNSSQAVSVLLTNASGSTIIFQDTSSVGSATVLNNGVLNLTGSANAGNAVISTNSGGSVSFTGNAQGGDAQFTVNSGGVFDISQSTGVTVGSIAGAGTFNLGAENLYTGNNNDQSTTVLGVIQDSVLGSSVTLGGSLTKGGLGTLTLTGQNTYTGGTSILGGTLVVDNGTLGSGAVTVGTSSTLDYAAQSVAANVIPNSGTINFNDSSSAGPSTITNEAFINFNDSASAGVADFTNNATVTFANNSTAAGANIKNNGRMSFSDGSTAGNVYIDNIGTGSLYFAGDSAATVASAGNAQITSSGFVSFGSYSTAGNAQITNNSGSIQFSGSAQGGTAQLTLNGGDLDISSSTTGSVTVASVDSAVGSSINLGANNLTMVSLSSLSSGSNISGTIMGNGGSLTDLGNLLILANANTYSGGTSILVGATLSIDNPNALGTGSVVNEGVVETLGGPLTINIGGNYTQNSMGTYYVGFAGISSGQWDTLNVTGSAALSGTLLVFALPQLNPTLGESFEILSAAEISGNFTSVINSITNFDFRFLPFYTPTQVDLVAIQPSFAALGETFNEKAVGAALDNLYLNPADEALMLNLGVQQAASLVKAYDQISPAGITPLFQMGFATEESRGALVTKRLADLWDQADSQSQSAFAGKGGPMFASTMSPGQEAAIANGSSSSNQWDVFMNGLGDFGRITEDSNAPGYQFSIGGMAAGMDCHFSRDLVGGLLLGFTSSGTSQSLSSVDSTGGQVGLYGGWKSGGLYVNGLVDGGVNNYTTVRASYGGNATGTTRGMQYGFQLGAGYDWKVDQMKVGPMVTGQYTYVQANAFQEMGSMTPLTFPNQGQGDLTSQLGVKASRNLNLGGFSLGPNLSAAWEHVYQGSLDQLQADLGNSTNLFKVDGPALGTNAAVIVAGLNAQFGNGLSAQAQYQGNMGMTGYSSQGLSAGLNLGF